MGAKLDDKTGRRYGRLTVLYRAENRYNHPVWLCICDCGTETKVRANNLSRGDTTSCGCYRREFSSQRWRRPKGLAAINNVAYQLQYRAKTRGIPWGLTREETIVLISQPCFYCGCSPKHEWRRPDVNGGCRWNGIDRVDNKQGYTKENAVSCCGPCNKAKLDRSLDDFLEWVRQVYHHRAREGSDTK